MSLGISQHEEQENKMWFGSGLPEEQVNRVPVKEIVPDRVYYSNIRFLYWSNFVARLYPAAIVEKSHLIVQAQFVRYFAIKIVIHVDLESRGIQ